MIQDCLSDSFRRNVFFDGRERKKQQVQAAAFYSSVSWQMQYAQSRGQQVASCGLLG